MLHFRVTGSVWVISASMETMLELRAPALRNVKARIRPLFTQVRVAASAGLFLDGLLGPERRKTGWMRAEAADKGAHHLPCRYRFNEVAEAHIRRDNVAHLL